jgi:sulfite reductase (ferredoxin)
MRLAPDETAYIINLTGSEAKQILELTDDSAKTPFEASVSCIGASICQVGARDSQGLLTACVEAVRQAQLPASALPKIHISGCPSSCGTHQTGEMGFRGGVKKVDGKVWPAFVLYVGGCDYQGKETMGQQLGTIEETKIPEFLVTLGRHVAESGMEFHEWRQKNPDMLENLAKPYLA